MPRDDWDHDVQDHAVDTDDVYDGYDPEPVKESGLSGSEDGAATRRLTLGVKACQVDPDIAGRVSGAKRHNVFGHNGTLDLMTFSQSRLSCNPSSWCRRNCYAGFIRLAGSEKTLFSTNKYTTDSTEKSHLANWCLSRGPGFVEVVVNAVARECARPQPMRIFSEGDFTDEDNVNDWGQVARRYPQHWWTFYTRKWQFEAFHEALVALARQPNVTIEMSWDPSMPWFLDPQYPQFAPLLKHMGVAITGLSATAVMTWQGIHETAQKYGTRFVFCPKNLSKVCNAEWEGMSCKLCRWCYGVNKRPWVYYMLHGLGAGKDRGWDLNGESVTGRELEKADKALAEQMVRAGMEPGPFRVGECFEAGLKHKRAAGRPKNLTDAEKRALAKVQKDELLGRQAGWLKTRGVLPDERISDRTDVGRMAQEVRKRARYGR